MGYVAQGGEHPQDDPEVAKVDVTTQRAGVLAREIRRLTAGVRRSSRTSIQRPA